MPIGAISSQRSSYVDQQQQPQVHILIMASRVLIVAGVYFSVCMSSDGAAISHDHQTLIQTVVRAHDNNTAVTVLNTAHPTRLLPANLAAKILPHCTAPEPPAQSSVSVKINALDWAQTFSLGGNLWYSHGMVLRVKDVNV